MIKRINLSLFFIFAVWTSLLKAQTGREWIVSGQPYYKIPVVQEAVYAIPFTQLNSSGISTTDPAKLQVWFRGVEQSIYINNSNDSLFFYGHGNDGALDSLIYEPMNARPNKYYSLFSDTTYYFLTVASVNGKRLNPNTATPGIVQSNQLHTEIVSYSQDYQAGQLYSSDTHLSPGDIGEGWMSNTISQSGTTPKDYTINVPVSNLYSGGADPQLEILLIGTNNNTHNIDILIGNPSSPSQVYSIPYFYARSVYKFNQTFPLSNMPNNQPLMVTVRVKGNTIDPDYVAVAYLTLIYPQTTDVTGKSFYTLQPLADNNAKTLSFSGFTNNSFLWDVSTEGAFVNLNYNYIGSGSASANLLSSVSKILYVNSFNPVIGIQQVDMTPYPVTSAEMLLITHTKLLSGTGITNFVSHRSSPAGGNISIAVTDVNKLYNLYTYGEKHCMAIKRYCQEQIDAGSPKYLFLVGKGINYDYFGTTDNGDYFYRKNPVGFINNHHTYQQLDYRMEDLIPPYGWPASDLYYTITDLTLRPKLATGRLSARTDADVNQYVDKLIANDTLSSNVIWRKNLVHLSGGKTSDEVQSFQAVVNGFKSIVEGPLFGGKVVRSYAKNLSSGAVDTKLIYSIADEVNKGISYLTFFGHSSPSIIDLDIGNVSNPVYGYNNVGKYPVLIQDGCQSAEFFIQGCIPEDWIMTPKKGALITFGHGDIGYPTYMQTYTNNFYKLNFADSRYINASLGDVHKKSIDTFLTIYNGDPNPAIVKAQATQYVLQGDPSVKVYKPQLTDYAIAGDAEAGEKKVFISAYSNIPISATVDSFAVAIPITNYGLSSSKNLQIQVKHTVINNNVTVIDETFPIKTIGPIGYVDTIYFTIRANNPKLLGINKFTITVDPFDSIPEFNEHNNVATLQYYLPLSSVSCLYPLEYSVVHDQPVSFVAQSIDLFEAQTNYYVEIDTSHLYNSPAKIIKTIASGPLVKFTQTLLTDVLPSDSIVYYWRIRFQDPGQDTLWGESSFIYIKDSPDGWSQSEYPQLFKDSYKNISISPQGALSFNTNSAILSARTQGNDPNNEEIGYNHNTLLSFIPGGATCTYDNGALIVVFDAETTLPYQVPFPATVPYFPCGVSDHPTAQRFLALDDAAVQTQLETFLKSVKKDEFVLFMTTGNAHIDTWSASLKAVFTANFGAQHMADLGAQTPYILLAKNRPGTTPLQEIYSTDVTMQISLDNYELIGTYKSGTITSTLIGPSTGWGTLYHTFENKVNDFSEISIIRINSQGEEVDVIGVPQTGNVDLNPLIDAAAFPYIRLQMYAQDTTDLTPAYLKKWQVIYAPAPEGTIDVSTVGGPTKYTVSDKNIGQTFTLPYAFENISNVDFAEPLRVVFALRNDRGGLKYDTITIGLLPKGQTVQFNYTVNIGNSAGKNVLQAYVNPRLQREVYYQNNILETSFNVQDDKTHPVIGAMFDGVQIFDGDVVSPQPLMTMVLTDNNQLATLGDSTMSIVIVYPDQSSHTIFKGAPGVLMWGPDPQKQGKFVVEYKPPVDFADGKYKLIVQGKDASGNRSGNQNMEINFQVVNQSTITNFYPYPNPFSTSTRFVFTLTGKDIPEDIKIQIMTVSGKVVREIFKSELGNIHAGDNITDYAWDGRDEYGDKLANGVYIYRVIIKNQGNDFEHRETSGDKAFKKGYGKLYILR